jgi:hypothetical protein
VGEFCYVLKTYLPLVNGVHQTLDFYTASGTDYAATVSADAPILDFFSYNSALVRSGIVSLNTRQPPVLAALLMGTLLTENGPTTNTVPRFNAGVASQNIVNAAAVAPALSRADIVRLAANTVTTSPFNATNETKSTIARALAENVQTRTWGLLIDIIAQSGHYSPNAEQGPSANPLANFVVDGEKRYWLHIAIDRFDGTVVGQQLEEVSE